MRAVDPSVKHTGNAQLTGLDSKGSTEAELWFLAVDWLSEQDQQLRRETQPQISATAAMYVEPERALLGTTLRVRLYVGRDSCPTALSVCLMQLALLVGLTLKSTVESLRATTPNYHLCEKGPSMSL